MTDITLPRAELEQWLVALLFVNWSELYKVEGVITALRERLAQPEQDDEPATCWKCGEDGGTSCGAEACGLIEAQPQPEQEPVAYINVEKRRLEFAEPMVWHTPTVVKLERIPLYTHQRTWVGLTDEEILHRIDTHIGVPSQKYPLDISDLISFARVIEHESRGKNT